MLDNKSESSRIYPNNSNHSDTIKNSVIIIKFEQFGFPIGQHVRNMQSEWQTL